jgi:hypothetical protein
MERYEEGYQERDIKEGYQGKISKQGIKEGWKDMQKDTMEGISRKDTKEIYQGRISKKDEKQGYQGWKSGKGFKEGAKKSRERRRWNVGRNGPIIFNTSSPTSSRPLTSKVRTWYL